MANKKVKDKVDLRALEQSESLLPTEGPLEADECHTSFLGRRQEVMRRAECILNSIESCKHQEHLRIHIAPRQDAETLEDHSPLALLFLSAVSAPLEIVGNLHLSENCLLTLISYF